MSGRPTKPTTEARIRAAADWLMDDDTAYESSPESALRAAREMLAAADTITPPPIPHHQLRPGDILRWQCPVYPANVHRWRVRSCCHGGLGQESLIEMESITHTPGYGAEFPVSMPIVIVPEVLVRNLEIEDVGEQFGLASSRRGVE